MEFNRLFEVPKPVIGMIHLSGTDRNDKVKRALEELSLYQEEGIDGAIIEDYHGSIVDVMETLRKSDKNKYSIIRGVNLLSDPYSSFQFARRYGAKFVQFDSVQKKDLDLSKYNSLRNKYKDLVVLGGIRFKYTTKTGNLLEQDISEGNLLSDAIVTTGDRTGSETPINKLRDFRGYMSRFPLIVGAGVNKDNVRQQLEIADGAIVGSYFKYDNNTENEISRDKVKDLMGIVLEIRKNLSVVI